MYEWNIFFTFTLILYETKVRFFFIYKKKYISFPDIRQRGRVIACICGEKDEPARVFCVYESFIRYYHQVSSPDLTPLHPDQSKKKILLFFVNLYLYDENSVSEIVISVTEVKIFPF